MGGEKQRSEPGEPNDDAIGQINRQSNYSEITPGNLSRLLAAWLHFIGMFTLNYIIQQSNTKKQKATLLQTKLGMNTDLPNNVTADNLVVLVMEWQ